MKNKILIILSIIIFTISVLAINVFAVINSATFKLSTSKENYEVGEEVVLTIRLDSINADRGIISYGALLEYDRDILQYVSCSGIGNWTMPFYNDENGKMTADRNVDYSGLEGEDLCTFKFTVKKDGKATFKLSDITLSNGGNAPGKASNVETSINIENQVQDEPSDDDNNTITDNNTVSGEDNTIQDDNNVIVDDNTTSNDDNTVIDNNTTSNDDNTVSDNNSDNTLIFGGNTNNNNNNSNNNNSNTDLSTNAKNQFPKLGANNYLYVLIAFVVALTFIWYKKLKFVNKKIKKQVNYLVADEMKKELEK